MQVEGQRGASSEAPPATGARVSYAYRTCPVLGNSPAKAGLMPGVVAAPHEAATKDIFRYGMAVRPISLTAG